MQLAPEDAGFTAMLQRQLDKGRKQVVAAAPGAEKAEDEHVPALQPFPRITRAAIEALRYRAVDTASSLTKTVIKEARTKELRLELLNSERLQSHFEAHPDDLALLQHDKLLHRTVPVSHLKHIPIYLMKDPFVHAAMQTRNKGVLLPNTWRQLDAGKIPAVKGGFGRAPRLGDAMDPLTAAELSISKIKAFGAGQQVSVDLYGDPDLPIPSPHLNIIIDI